MRHLKLAASSSFEEACAPAMPVPFAMKTPKPVGPFTLQKPTAGSVSWSFFDNAVDQATSRGLRVMAILWGTPSWGLPSMVRPTT